MQSNPYSVNRPYDTGHAVFEATHGTAPNYAGRDMVSPGSLVLSAEMMLRYMGWKEAADRIVSAMDRAIASRNVTHDFARLMDGADRVSCSELGRIMIRMMLVHGGRRPQAPPLRHVPDAVMRVRLGLRPASSSPSS